MATTAIETVRATLAADATLVAIATGGVVSMHGSGRAPINEEDTPDVYVEDADSGVMVMRPCVVLSVTAEPVIGPTGIGRQEWLRVSAYDPAGGYANTQAMLVRIHNLLHYQHIALTNGNWIHLEHVDTPYRVDVDETIETGYGGRRGPSMEGARYTMVTGWAAY